MKQLPVFLDVDTQVDFMLPEGSLYVPGVEEIIPNLKRLFAYAEKQHIPVLSSADAHPPDDPSFTQWPPHCVVGTPGQRRIPETSFQTATVVANRSGEFTAPAEWDGQWIIEKTEYDVSTNPNFDDIVSSLENRRFVVFGVTTEFCVRGAVLALRSRVIPVDVVEDAIRGITPEAERQAIEEMRDAGAGFVSTDYVCKLQVSLAGRRR